MRWSSLPCVKAASYKRYFLGFFSAPLLTLQALTYPSALEIVVQSCFLGAGVCGSVLGIGLWGSAQPCARFGVFPGLLEPTLLPRCGERDAAVCVRRPAPARLDGQHAGASTAGMDESPFQSFNSFSTQGSYLHSDLVCCSSLSELQLN